MSLDEKARVIEVDEKKYRRVGRYDGTYYTKAGPVTVRRTLYRNAAVRNDKAVDAISLKLGCVEDGWLPEAADAMAYLLQNAPGAEAEKLARKRGRLPYSASSFKRVGGAVGGLFEAQRSEAEDSLIAFVRVHEAMTYLTNQSERMGYVDAREAGLPIGSGNVEATCKSLVHLRMPRRALEAPERPGHAFAARSCAQRPLGARAGAHPWATS